MNLSHRLEDRDRASKLSLAELRRIYGILEREEDSGYRFSLGEFEVVAGDGLVYPSEISDPLPGAFAAICFEG